ncbi:MAG: DnaJ domain-containing protein [Gammaproteobacteria bacterium]|nr:DnaJ domain-containing protein [Gammaproteobacteria bacterium]
MFKDNPLILTVLSALKESDSSLSLYQLMKILENTGFDLERSSKETSYDMRIFRKNFVVMNALYQLKKDMLDSGYSLFISSLKIELIAQNGVENRSLIIDSAEDLLTQEALSAYYLNWDNYNSIDDQGVVDLLKSFWNSYTDYNQRHFQVDKRLDSLQVLGLESSASWKDIQQTYRQLVKVYHPDKGGNSLKFIRIREAYLILKLTLIKSH